MDYVVRKATPAPKESIRGRSPGRPVQFDRQEVIDRAVQVFWQNGANSTSLDVLVSELGVSRSTLYSSFGGKDGLLASATDAYLARLSTELVAPLHDSSAGLQDLLDFLDRLRPVLLGPDYPAGCLVVNAMSDGQNSEPSRRFLDIFLAGFRAALNRAVAAQEIDPAEVEPFAAMLMSQIIGLNVAVRADLGANLVDPALNAMRNALKAPLQDTPEKR